MIKQVYEMARQLVTHMSDVKSLKEDQKDLRIEVRELAELVKELRSELRQLAGLNDRDRENLILKLGKRSAQVRTSPAAA